MRCMAILVAGLLTAVLVPAVLAQDSEAEKLFHAMEKKIAAAKAIQVTVDIELRAIQGRSKESKIGNGVSKGRATLLLTKENQARLKLRNEYLGIMLISDGKQLKLLSDQDDLSEAKARPAPHHLHNLLSTLVSRLGVTGGSMIMRFAPGPQFEPINACWPPRAPRGNRARSPRSAPSTSSQQSTPEPSSCRCSFPIH